GITNLGPESMSISTTEDADRSAKFAAVLQGGSETEHEHAPPPRRRRRIPRWATIGTGVLVTLALVGATVKSSLLTPATTSRNILTEKVRRADLIVSITEDGNVESAANNDIRCEVKGGSTILW